MCLCTGDGCCIKAVTESASSAPSSEQIRAMKTHCEELGRHEALCAGLAPGTQRQPWALTSVAPTYLPDHGASIIDQLSQHHGHIVVDGGRVVCPLSRVSHKGTKGKHSCTSDLQGRRQKIRVTPTTDVSAICISAKAV